MGIRPRCSPFPPPFPVVPSFLPSAPRSVAWHGMHERARAGLEITDQETFFDFDFDLGFRVLLFSSFLFFFYFVLMGGEGFFFGDRDFEDGDDICLIILRD